MEWTLDQAVTVYLLCGLATGAWQGVDLLANGGEGLAKALRGIPVIDQLPWIPRIWLVWLVVGNLVMWPATLLWALRQWMAGSLLRRLRAYQRRLELELASAHESDQHA
jgi:hypothetical protein